MHFVGKKGDRMGFSNQLIKFYYLMHYSESKSSVKFLTFSSVSMISNFKVFFFFDCFFSSDILRWLLTTRVGLEWGFRSTQKPKIN